MNVTRSLYSLEMELLLKNLRPVFVNKDNFLKFFMSFKPRLKNIQQKNESIHFNDYLSFLILRDSKKKRKKTKTHPIKVPTNFQWSKQEGF